MKKNNKHTISENELDNLLNQAFVDLDFNKPKNSEIMETIANYNIPVNQSWYTKLINASLKLKLTIVASILLLITGIFYFKSVPNNKPENIAAQLQTQQEQDQQEIKDEIPVKAIESMGLEPKPSNDNNTKNASEVLTTYADEEAKTEVEINNNVPIKEDNAQLPNLDTEKPTEYVFPVLTEKEIKLVEKEKKKMAKMAVKRSSSRYSAISLAKGDMLNSFYLQNAEVSNLEYRTFLFDLLIQNRKSDFLIAKPEQALWKNSNGASRFDYLKDVYFSIEGYNDYPVVNISKEGAEMYCKWLSELATNYIKSADGTMVVECTLPTENEWAFAAKAGKTNATYPWGYDSIQNSSNRFLANFCVQKMQEKFKQPIVYGKAISKTAYTSAGLALNMDSIATAKVYSYNPNDFGLYCMSGNVSEMVYTSDGSVKAKGGNWASDFEHLRIESEDEFKEVVKPSPMIGFRVKLKVKAK